MGQAVARITAALECDAGVDAGNVHVAASGTTLELTGQVRSWAELRQAGHAADSPARRPLRRRVLETSHGIDDASLDAAPDTARSCCTTGRHTGS